MAQLHNALVRGNWSDALKRALGETKSPGGIERYGETLTPLIDLWSQPEWAFLRLEQLWAFSQVSAAVVAERSGVAVVNPAGSNRVVTVLLGSVAHSVAAGQIAMQLITEAVIIASYSLFAGGGLAMPSRDSRVGGTSLRMSLPQFWSGSDAGLITTNLRSDLITSPTAAEFRPLVTAVPVVLSPGFALLAEGTAANQAVTVNMSGKIRTALPGELG